MKTNVLTRRWKKYFLSSKKKVLFTLQRVDQTISMHPKTKLLHSVHQGWRPELPIKLQRAVVLNCS